MSYEPIQRRHKPSTGADPRAATDYDPYETDPQLDAEFEAHRRKTFAQLVGPRTAASGPHDHVAPNPNTQDREPRAPHRGDPGTLFFDGFEHRAYGDKGAQEAGWNHHYEGSRGTGRHPTPPLALTHGDIVMLSGDFFDPRERDASDKPIPDNLFKLAQTPSTNPGQKVGTQDEVICGLKQANPGDERFDKKLGGEFSHIVFSSDVEDNVNKRYLQLASRNYEHFVDPSGPGTGGPTTKNRGSAGGSYRALHEEAILRAHNAKIMGAPIDEAMMHEAAAEHFLTDAFSAGHVRTPRKSIQQYWDAKYPLFFENFKKTVAQDMAIYIKTHDDNFVTSRGSVYDLMKGILEQLEQSIAGIPDVTFGGLVSATTHDCDNANGLWVKNDLGEAWQTFGDGFGGVPSNNLTEQQRKRLAPQQDTKHHAEAAVKLSAADVLHAYEVAPIASPQEVTAHVRARTLAPAHANREKYGAEQMMPVLDEAKAADNGTLQWEQPNFEALWSTAIRTDRAETYGEIIGNSLKPKGGIYNQLEGLTAKIPATKTKYFCQLHPLAAYRDSFLAGITSNPEYKISQIINFDPGRGGVPNDKATEHDLDRLKSQRADATDIEKPNTASHSRLNGLTMVQRVEYLTNLVPNRELLLYGQHGQYVLDIIDTTPVNERDRLFEALAIHGFKAMGLPVTSALWEQIHASR